MELKWTRTRRSVRYLTSSSFLVVKHIVRIVDVLRVHFVKSVPSSSWSMLLTACVTYPTATEVIIYRSESESVVVVSHGTLCSSARVSISHIVTRISLQSLICTTRKITRTRTLECTLELYSRTSTLEHQRSNTGTDVPKTEDHFTCPVSRVPLLVLERKIFVPTRTFRDTSMVRPIFFWPGSSWESFSEYRFCFSFGAACVQSTVDRVC